MIPSTLARPGAAPFC